MSVDAMSNCI